jgi:hypothetical protein
MLTLEPLAPYFKWHMAHATDDIGFSDFGLYGLSVHLQPVTTVQSVSIMPIQPVTSALVCPQTRTLTFACTVSRTLSFAVGPGLSRGVRDRPSALCTCSHAYFHRGRVVQW